jgi:hypothetical protein
VCFSICVCVIQTHPLDQPLSLEQLNTWVRRTGPGTNLTRVEIRNYRFSSSEWTFPNISNFDSFALVNVFIELSKLSLVFENISLLSFDTLSIFGTQNVTLSKTNISQIKSFKYNNALELTITLPFSPRIVQVGSMNLMTTNAPNVSYSFSVLYVMR